MNPKVRLCKPSSVPVFRRAAIISLDQPLPTGSPAPQRRWASGLWEATYPPAERPSAARTRAECGWGPKRRVPRLGTLHADRLLGLAGGGVFPAGDVAAAAVRSYRTISPLPEPREGPSAVCFLWHFPWDYSRWPLATTAPCPARTFLPASRKATQSDRPSRPLRFTIYYCTTFGLALPLPLTQVPSIPWVHRTNGTDRTNGTCRLLSLIGDLTCRRAAPTLRWPQA